LFSALSTDVFFFSPKWRTMMVYQPDQRRQVAADGEFGL